MATITDTYEDFVKPEEVFEYFVYVQTRLQHGKDCGKIYTYRLPKTVFDEAEVQQLIDEDLEAVRQSFVGSHRDNLLKHRKYRVYKTLWTEIKL
ncbi:hypothetical protein PP940_gp075 [Rhizobium phage RL2RES]|uniref:Uncharacterized protein n=1 Tax=Rhizobium phage RL2RES TaxID=103371 RepID=A0A6B9J7Q4_9CAUD|nr:hypothetical protein PP940_gp075 [Rhizobium phage RL2RES]QGZ14271.1 hypothetical protein RL2RES_075 [Rhizobium phage RL2RES]